MTTQNTDAVQPAQPEETTSKDSSTEPKTTESPDTSNEDAADKILGPKGEPKEKSILKKKGFKKEPKLSPEEQAKWDNQPESATLSGQTSPAKGQEKTEAQDDSESADGADAQTQALQKEKERIEQSSTQLLEDIKVLRSQRQGLKKTKAELEEKIEDETPDDEFETEDDKFETYFNRRFEQETAKQEFYQQYPDIYLGPNGHKNRQLVEEYLKLQYPKNLEPGALAEVRQFVHQKYFGVSQANTKLRNQLLMNDIAALGSGKGGTSIQPPAPKKKKILIPKSKPVSEWY